MFGGMNHLRIPSLVAFLVAASLAVAEEKTAGTPKPSVPENDAALQRKVGEIVFRHRADAIDLPIGWHQIRGLDGSQWHILGTHWWVELHRGTRGLERLKKSKQYVVHGVPLEQRYGVIDIWAYKITEKQPPRQD